MQLVIQTFGTSLHRKQNAFEVYVKGDKTKISVHKISSIILTKGAKISSDAVLLAIENQIEILFLDRTGHPQGRVWSNRYGSISTIRKNQLLFTQSGEAAQWTKKLVTYKINAQAAVLKSLYRDRPAKQAMLDEAIKSIVGYATKVKEATGQLIGDIDDSLRGWEGNASRVYFRTISDILPPQYRFERRSRRPAKDMFNSMLNYMYGILYGRIEGSLIIAGIDPYLGILHRDEYNRPVLVYDIIEKYRCWAETTLIQLCIRRLPTNEMFSVEDGGFWLEGPGRKLVIQTFNDYLDEVVQMNGKRRSRLVHIQDDAYTLAKMFLKSDDKQETGKQLKF